MPQQMYGGPLLIVYYKYHFFLHIGKRTIHNPYATNHKPWDPYGIARFDLSSLLLGQKTVYMSAPIHGCLPPDILGTRSEHGGKLYGVSGAVDGPQDAPLASGHYIESHSVVKISIHLAHPLVTPVQLAEGRQLQSSEQVNTNLTNIM